MPLHPSCHVNRLCLPRLRFCGTALLVLIPWLHARAAPACPDPFMAGHPGGGRSEFRLCGDEYFSWVEDAAGNVFTYDAAGNLCFARLENHRLLPLDSTIPPPAPLRRGDILSEARRARAGTRTAAAFATFATDDDAIPPYIQTPPPVTPPAPRPLLVIITSFSDITAGFSPGLWHDLIFGANGKTVNTYFNAVSKNHFHFLPAHETHGTTNDAIIHVTLPYAHPDTTGMDSVESHTAVRDALIAAAAFADFSAYDADGDGALSATELSLLLIFAGYEASYYSAHPQVWAHNTHLGANPATGTPTFDGVSVGGGGYAIIGERHGTLHTYTNASIGVICHELAHSFGIWDLYDYDNSSSGIGAHGLMGIGNWGQAHGDTMPGQTPVFLCAFHRLFLGFSQPATVESGTFTLTAASLAGMGDTDLLKFQTARQNEYFLIENRQPQGFDQGLQRYFGSTETQGGIAVWHIDEDKYAHLGNDDENHKAVDLEEANEKTVGYSQLDENKSLGSRQHYFYAENTGTFDDDTMPPARLYNDTPSGLVITNVSSSGNTMSLTLRAKAPGTPAAPAASDAAFDDKITLSWPPARDADGYAVYRTLATFPADITQIGATPATTFDDTTPVQGHNYLYWIAATNAWGSGTRSAPATGRSRPADFATVLSPALTWTTGGHQPWFIQTNSTFDTTPTPQSGIINHNQASWIQAVLAGPCILSFYWLTSSEPNYDLLTCNVNNSNIGSIHGYRVTDWYGPATLTFPRGTHTIRWTYHKDGQSTRGLDTAWLAAVEWHPAAVESPIPVPHAWLDTHTFPAPADFDAYEAAAIATGLNGVPLWQSYLAGLDPRDSGSHFTAAITFSNNHPRIIWTPDLGTRRTYSLEGKPTLSAPWGATNSASRFFRVKVTLPGY